MFFVQACRDHSVDAMTAVSLVLEAMLMRKSSCLPNHQKQTAKAELLLYVGRESAFATRDGLDSEVVQRTIVYDVVSNCRFPRATVCRFQGAELDVGCTDDRTLPDIP